MHDLSLTILDLAMNSIRAKARNLSILLDENSKDNRFSITIEDDGEGIGIETPDNAWDPFYTTRETRKVGLGLSLFSEMIRLCDGEVSLTSSKKGTKLTGWMKCDHMNRPQTGNMASTILTLLLEENVRLEFVYRRNENVVRIDSNTIQMNLSEDGFIHLSNNRLIYKQLAKELEVLYGGENEISRRFKED